MTIAPKTSSLIQVYGTDSCTATSAARRTLEKYNAPYEYVDIEKFADAGAWIASVAGGKDITPVIDFYGQNLIQPDDEKILTMLTNSGVRQGL